MAKRLRKIHCKNCNRIWYEDTRGLVFDEPIGKDIIERSYETEECLKCMKY